MNTRFVPLWFAVKVLAAALAREQRYLANLLKQMQAEYLHVRKRAVKVRSACCKLLHAKSPNAVPALLGKAADVHAANAA